MESGSDSLNVYASFSVLTIRLFDKLAKLGHMKIKV